MSSENPRVIQVASVNPGASSSATRPITGKRQPVVSRTVEELPQGLYEVLVTEGLKARLEALADALPTDQRALRVAEAPDRIAWHLSREIERALSGVSEADRVGVGIEVARALLDRLGELVEVDPSTAPVDPATVLHAILGRRPDGSPEVVAEPLIPLLDTTLSRTRRESRTSGTSCAPRSNRRTVSML